MSDAFHSAMDLFGKGIMPLPVPYGQKNPSDRKGWELERYKPDDFSAFQRAKLNVGMRLGHITDKDGTVLTDRFVDIDLDIPEAAKVAPFFLPPTTMRWGRRGNPNSHWGYRLVSVDGAKTIQTFNDPTNPRDGYGKSKARVCEIRFNGQTIAPGSVWIDPHDPNHIEDVRWEKDGNGQPSEVEFGTLVSSVNRLYAAALLARYWTEGIRHSCAVPLAGLLCYGGMEETDAETFVKAVCAAAGDNGVDDRVRAINTTYDLARRGQPYTGGPTLAEYVDRAVVNRVRRALDLKQRTGTAVVLGPDNLPLTDMGNAERFANLYEGQAVYCDDERQWYLYEGGVWSPDRSNKTILLVRNAIGDWRGQVLEKAKDLGDAGVSKCNKHADIWSSERGIRNCLSLATALLPVRPEQFDSDPWLLNVRNGTLILGTDGSHYRREPDWRDFCTKQWNADYEPDASHPDLEWYRSTFVPEVERWTFLEEALGYTLTGLPKRFNFQLLGPSHSGKSMWLRIIKSHSGRYGSSLRYSALKPESHGGGDKPRSDLLSLRGARLLTIAEVDGGTVWDSTLFKTMLSGGDFYTVRGVHDKRGQTFPFTVSLWTSGNDPYGADASDDAAYERVHVLKFDHPIPEGDRDDNREDEIVNPERTGNAVLAMALRGFQRLYGEKRGALVAPDSVRRETRQLRDTIDPFTYYLEQLVEITGSDKDGVLKTELQDAVKELMATSGRKVAWGSKMNIKLAMSLERKGATALRTTTRYNNREHYRGVRWNVAGFISVPTTQPDWET